ncbi:MAG TPA: cation diffusion facilitator family transporter [Acidimicrobiales bacterium]|nr:cation diffusion facilitator family transporter [Acidimicrobiales bacterium]
MDRQARRTRRLTMAVALNVALAVVQVVSGLLAHSVALLSDAGHNVTDVAGLCVALVAVRWALRPRSDQRSYGHHRGTILAALANAAVIAVVTAGIIVAGLQRLAHPRPVHGTIVLAVAAAAFVINASVAASLHEKSRDLNMRAAAVHMAADAVASLAVAAAGVVLVVDPALRWADPVASLGVGLLIIVEAYRIMRSSVAVLLESTPPDVDLKALTAAMAEVPDVAEVHDLHVWSLSSEVRALSAHVVVAGHPTLEEAQVVGDRVKEAVGGPFAIAHSTLELECERCVEGDDDPCLMDTLVPRPKARP